MLEITPNIAIDENEIKIQFVQASGPGGQNVNKVATSAQLRFDVVNSPSLEPDIKERILSSARKRINKEGILIIEARRYRTQEQNRQDAVNRLVTILQKSLIRPKKRLATRPSVTSRAARLSKKKRRGDIKKTRRYVPDEWE